MVGLPHRLDTGQIWAKWFSGFEALCWSGLSPDREGVLPRLGSAAGSPVNGRRLSLFVFLLSPGAGCGSPLNVAPGLPSALANPSVFQVAGHLSTSLRSEASRSHLPKLEQLSTGSSGGVNVVTVGGV
jgi:hypothetical protein